MESYLEAPFAFDAPYNNPQHAAGASTSKQDAPLSPLTLSRLEESWKGGSSGAQLDRGQNAEHTEESALPSSAQSHHGRLASFSDDFDADFNFFASPGRDVSTEQSYVLGRNSLGLLDDTLLHLSPHAPSSAAMSHSQSASSALSSGASLGGLLGIHGTSGPPRKQAPGSPFGITGYNLGAGGHGDTSASTGPNVAFRNGSISEESHHAGSQHASRHDFSTGQSPKSAHRAAALGRYESHIAASKKAHQPSLDAANSPFDAANHATLLSLSQGGALRSSFSSDMGPPASTNRKATMTCTDSSDEPTPLASSMGTFTGQRHAMGTSFVNPSTPFTPRHQNIATPGSSYSCSSTPDDAAFAARFGGASPFTPASSRSSAGSLLGGLEIGQSPANGGLNMHHTFDEPLDAFWSPRSADNAGNGKLSSPDKAAADNYNGGNLSLFHRRAQHAAMTRMSSAPSLTPISIASANNSFSVPTTPSDCPPDSALSWTSSIPSTPGDVTLSLSPGFGSTSMAQSRSHGALLSTMSPPSISPLSLHDGTTTPSQTPGHHRSSFSEGMGHLSSPLAPSKNLKKGGSSTKGTGTTPRKAGARSSAGAPPPLVVSSADKVHVCHCGKRFKRMEHLKRHNRTHTQERPHKCPVEGCGKYFGRTDNLAQHLKTHFRASGLARASQHLLALSTSQGEHIDLRHDPHAAAAQAAAAAVQAAAGKRRSSTISHPGSSGVEDVLGGPISLTKHHHGVGGEGPHDAAHYSAASLMNKLSFSQAQAQHQHQHQQRPVLMTSHSANTSPANAFPMTTPFMAM